MTDVAQRPRVEHPRAPRKGPVRSGVAFLVGAIAVGVLLPLVSAVFGLYDRVEHWGKFVHAVDAACVTLAFGLLLLGWRERNRVDLSDELCTLLAMFVGVLFGISWEVAEFMIDWVLDSDLQKSNTDTMTDLLWVDAAAVLAALVAMRVYCHAATSADRAQLGGIAEWLADGPSRLLDRHGLALLTIVACVIAAAVATLWFAGRPVPGLPVPPL